MPKHAGMTAHFLALWMALCFLAPPECFCIAGTQSASGGLTKAAALSCDAKVKALESYAGAPVKGKERITRISETEMNSYLAFILKPSFHPSLSSLTLRFEAGHIQGTARIDFDKLQFKSAQVLSGLMRAMLSGVHTLTVRGILVAKEGKAHFQLEEASFDTVTLPNFLVSEIISAVGRRQDPPFDPVKPNVMPYGIQKAEIHLQYILLYQ